MMEKNNLLLSPQDIPDNNLRVHISVSGYRLLKGFQADPLNHLPKALAFFGVFTVITDDTSVRLIIE